MAYCKPCSWNRQERLCCTRMFDVLVRLRSIFQSLQPTYLYARLSAKLTPACQCSSPFELPILLHDTGASASNESGYNRFKRFVFEQPQHLHPLLPSGFLLDGDVLLGFAVTFRAYALVEGSLFIILCVWMSSQDVCQSVVSLDEQLRTVYTEVARGRVAYALRLGERDQLLQMFLMDIRRRHPYVWNWKSLVLQDVIYQGLCVKMK